MAKRHNEFSQLLGTVENDPQPLVGVLPISGVPSLNDVADNMEALASYHADTLNQHVQTLRDLAKYQPEFKGGTIQGG